MLALQYFTQAKEMWNSAGLYDKPTREDGFYSTYKLALLLHVANVLNQTLPFRSDLEYNIWRFQRADGGIRSHYLGNMTSNREANSETTSLVLLVYQYEAEQLRLKTEIEEQIRLKEAEERRNLLAGIFIIIVCVTVIVVTVILWRRKKHADNKTLNINQDSIVKSQ
jgi:hypothetical protein